jgi:DNA topoisomerase-1
VIATIVRLLETSLIRVGNEEYASANGSYGLTTMRAKHVDVEGSSIRFEFPSKSGRRLSVKVRDARLASVVRRCREIPGQELFRYYDQDGVRQIVDSADVNDYLRETAGAEFSAKDFRTWAGTLYAATALAAAGPAPAPTQAAGRIAEAIRHAAERLNNTPAVCRKSYVHPAVTEAFLRGLTLDDYRGAASVPGLSADEQALLAMLREKRAHARSGAPALRRAA